MSSEITKIDFEEGKLSENSKENINNENNKINEDEDEENTIKNINLNHKNKETLEKVEFSKIIGNYLLYDQIGMGSFSKVTKAIHLITEQTVAVKILEKEKIEDEIDIERIIREIEILKTIMHPNIAQMYETYSTVHNIYLMMEFVEGGDLFDYITKNSFLSEPIACHIYRQIVSVLDYLTEMGISHRDIKPENILLDKSYKNIKFIDFGLSNYCKNKELLHSSCGSPCYASPEMLSGRPYRGVTTDVWSSGVVLYSMLVGSLPFDDQEIQKLYEQIKLGKFYLPSTLSLEAIDLLKRILEVNPKKRITLKDIKEHPWFTKTQNPLYKGIIYNPNSLNENKFPYNNQVISYVIKEYYKDDKNINNKKLIEMIEKHEINQYTATYYIVKRHILRIEDNNYEIYNVNEKNNKINLKVKNNNINEKEKEKKELSRNEKKIKENKRSNTEDNMVINKIKNQKNKKIKYYLFSNNNKNIENNYLNNNKEKNNIREDLSNKNKDIPKLDLKNINLLPINNNRNKNPYTLREISPQNNLNNLYDINLTNINNPINILKTEENERNNNLNLYKDNKNNIRNDILHLDNEKICTNNKTKKKGVILSFSKNEEKNNVHNKSNRLFIKDFDDEINSETSINRKKKANSHRKKYFNMIPKLNISNNNIGNNYKKNMNIHIINYINNKDKDFINLKNNNNSNYNNARIKNSFNFLNFNKNITFKNKNNKNYIFAYLNTNMSRNKEIIHNRNLSSGIKRNMQNSNNGENNNLLLGTKLGLLTKVNLKNNYNVKNLSRNNKNEEMSRTKQTEYTKSLEKNNYILTPRTLEQKSINNNRIANIEISQNSKGMINLKNIEKNKNWKINNNGIKNIKKTNININNIGNDNNSFRLNNNFINKCYLNKGNIINNNNNIILNIQNYYNRKNNKTYENINNTKNK